MIVNEQALELVFKRFKTVYTDAFTKAPVAYDRLAMTVPSVARDETYGWLGQFPQLREWLGGERLMRDLEAHGFTIVNRKFESTVAIRREDFENDRLGVFKPMFAEMGHLARQHPDEMIFPMLKAGFTLPCYDGQNFLDADHPTRGAAGALVTVSNVQKGTGPAWFLMDTSRAIRPIIWQERDAYDFQAITRPNDSHVFMTDEHVYGVRARVNAGFGLWQLAFGSKAALTPENYRDARGHVAHLRRPGPHHGRARDHAGGADRAGGARAPHRGRRAGGRRRDEPLGRHRRAGGHAHLDD